MAEDGQAVAIATLRWGVKQSFRNYVAATGGRIETADGALQAEDGAFTFPARPGGVLKFGADGAPEGRAAFVGLVRFEAHGGMLSVCLADPIVEIGASGGTISVADSPGRSHHLAIARLDLSAISRGGEGEMIIPAALTFEGSQWLGDHYPPGTAIDPVCLAPAPR